MSNTSATGGVLSPTGIPAPLEGDALTDFIQSWIVGITGLTAQNIRPRWQPEPANIPATGTNWAAIGIRTVRSDTYAAELHDPTLSGSSQLRRHEELEIFCSFYGPNADSYAKMLRDGCQIAQNRETLTLNNMGLISTGDLITAPEMIKEKWLMRIDLSLFIRHQVVRNYAVLNLLSANGQIITDVVTENFNT